MSISPASHLKPFLPNWLTHLECLQRKWPWPNFVENSLKCWDVLLGNMAYSQLAPYGKGHLLPSAICKERRLAKWWAAQRAKNMPQTRLEKEKNMEMYEETLWNKVKGNWALAKCVDLFFPSTWWQRVESLVASLTQVLKFDGHLKVAHPWKEPRLIHRIVEVDCWKKYGWGWDIVWLRRHEGTQIWFPWFCVGAGSCHLLSTYTTTSQLAHRHLSNEEQVKHASLSRRTARLRAVQNMLQAFQSECRATCSCTWPILLHDICSALRETELRQLL